MLLSPVIFVGHEPFCNWYRRVAHPQIKIRTLQKAKSAAPEKASQRRNVAEGWATRRRPKKLGKGVRR
jgi:hypothetical protein